MALTAGTGKMELRSGTPNKTVAAVLNSLKNFLSARGWTIYNGDKTTLTPGYFVATCDRSTGFVGDNPWIRVVMTSVGGTIYSLTIESYESWNFTTLVGTNLATNANTSPPLVDLALDTDIWMSTGDDTDCYVLVSTKIKKSSADGYYNVGGMACIERLAGDADAGTFYGSVGIATFNTSKVMYVPKLWDNSVGASAFFTASNRLGNTDNRGIYGPNEAGQHVVFPLTAHRSTLGKLKGKVQGLASSTYGFELSPGMLLPTVAAPQWLVAKNTADQKLSMLMAVTAPVAALAPSLV